MLMRCGMSTFDCRTRTPKQNSQACVGNWGRKCTGPWTQPNGGESIALKSWRLEDFPEAWRLRALFFTQDLETCILVHGDDFFIVGRQERKHALSLLRSAYELSKVVTFGPESSLSHTASFLSRTLTLRQW